MIGNPIDHSLSPVIHQAFAQQINLPLLYEKILGNNVAFEQQVSTFFTEGGKGLNVTLPFKQRAYALAEKHSNRSIKAGAANTLWYENNKLIADNTDGIGLLRDLARYLSLTNKRILVLGAGGAARGIIHPLLEAKPEILMVANRSNGPLETLQSEIKQIHCVNLSDLKGEFDLIINATSAGLHSDTLVPVSLFKNKPFCYDLSYRYKVPTLFVTYASQQNCQAVDGLGMLVEQAAESFYLWHGFKPDVAQVLSKKSLNLLR